MTTYSESARGILIDETRVRQECKAHGMDAESVEICLAEVKPNKQGLRKASAVLRWLGY